MNGKIKVELEFSEREKKLVKLLSEGNTVNQIEKILGRDDRTLENEVVKIRMKCAAENTAALVAFFYKHGLID